MELFGISDEPTQRDSIPLFLGFAKLIKLSHYLYSDWLLSLLHYRLWKCSYELLYPRK
jgi:hypothetical protein